MQLNFTKAPTALVTAVIFSGALMTGPAGAYAVSSAPEVSKERFEATLTGTDLENWLNLTSDKQDAIIKTVNDPRMTLDLSPEEAKEISPDLKVEKVEGVTAASSAEGYAPLVRGDARVQGVYYEMNFSQLGVPTGSARIDYTYVATPSEVLVGLSCEASYTGTIPDERVEVKTANWIDRGQGTCAASWAILNEDTKDFDVYDQGVTANALGIVEIWGPDHIYPLRQD
ncbi:hypothetical protein ODZ83_10940 [Acaricomes phytoseiuli]|uniref:hypothetical protein n=1 Tax=Acaricomes phytoseiuli TaxID=291968 RepID=UPI002222FD06|nr:hypothetical protein [Acaricomes phytoseiuli]MCW1250677.1 hypothetical protein [Acaricomes phytoseiuli]